jgi:hypothetical protein
MTSPANEMHIFLWQIGTVIPIQSMITNDSLAGDVIPWVFQKNDSLAGDVIPWVFKKPRLQF